MERKERKSPSSDTLYEVVSLESESERERRKSSSPGALSSGPGATVPSPPEDDEEEGDYCTAHNPEITPLHTASGGSLSGLWLVEASVGDHAAPR